jgi:N-acetylglucosamine malate deacetylase 2
LISPFAQKHVALICAHPDDETLGAGAQISSMSRLLLVYTTNGAPSRGAAEARGLRNIREYGAARANEAREAMALTGIPVEFHFLRFVDRRLTWRLAAAAKEIAQLLKKVQPDVVLTHAYEGGHPDHDATAFAVHAAAPMSQVAVPIWEMTGYHRASGELEYGVFIPHPGLPELNIGTTPRELERKRSMLACFRSQQGRMPPMPLDHERFRAAPEYDFTAPPHTGRLHYEHFNWGMTAERWCEFVRIAQRRLSIG